MYRVVSASDFRTVARSDGEKNRRLLGVRWPPRRRNTVTTARYRDDIFSRAGISRSRMHLTCVLSTRCECPRQRNGSRKSCRYDAETGRLVDRSALNGDRFYIYQTESELDSNSLLYRRTTMTIIIYQLSLSRDARTNWSLLTARNDFKFRNLILLPGIKRPSSRNLILLELIIIKAHYKSVHPGQVYARDTVAREARTNARSHVESNRYRGSQPVGQHNNLSIAANINGFDPLIRHFNQHSAGSRRLFAPV